MTSLLPVLFWILLVLYAVGLWFPAWQRPSSVIVIILLVLLGLRTFPVNLH